MCYVGNKKQVWMCPPGLRPLSCHDRSCYETAACRAVLDFKFSLSTAPGVTQFLTTIFFDRKK